MASKISKKLTISIVSFSYKNEIPTDTSGNGGGFVFDCRALPNPGREQRFKNKSGLDPEVAAYLKKEKSVQKFLSNCLSLVDQAVLNYRKRRFSHLMVCFGCTGGQHRSVYAVEWLKKKRQRKKGVSIKVLHTVIGKRK